ncbi:ribonuclease P protein component [Derxia lacustris]|uniref:ribonuclease P protein component n=1 Tax=Derxia lacustris TaxID=764842 RepID=UPI000A174274|nr:ribonuclease P protein component [Derxia lacustris]
MKRFCALVGPTAFSAVMKRRRAGGSVHFDLFVLAAADRPAPPEHLTAPVPDWRFGCVIGRKAVRRAVDRNLARRIAREALRAAIDSGLRPGDYVFRARRELGADSVKARKSTDRVSFRHVLRGEVDQLLARHVRPPASLPVASDAA